MILRLFFSLTILALVQLPALFAGPMVTQLKGELKPVRVMEEGAPVKSFQLIWYIPDVDEASAENVYAVEEDLYALPWFLRMGIAKNDATEEGPIVGYQLNDRPQLVALPHLNQRNRLTDPSNERPKERRQKKVDGRDCYVFQGQSELGRRVELTIDQNTGHLIEYSALIVIGRGDQFQLTLECDQIDDLSPAESARYASLAHRLKAILPDRTQELDPVNTIIPSEILQQINAATDDWSRDAAETEFNEYITSLLQEVGTRQQGQSNMQQLAKGWIGKTAPALPDTSLDGHPINRKDFEDKQIVLHFARYELNPPAAQFDQVGDLDFIARKYKPDNVEVIGVAMHSEFENPSLRESTSRTCRQFVEFMNLSYPIARDDGSLLQKFGVPISRNAPLPFWVVIAADGTIRHIHSGVYEQSPGAGLKELEAVISPSSTKK